ncbi:MAG: SPOR domain-containing protein [Acidobacteria bacterium]|nr:SPOR domain-containing protein [Acidobacteriota bacterium]
MPDRRILARTRRLQRDRGLARWRTAPSQRGLVDAQRFAEEVQARSLAQRLLKLDFPVVIQPSSKDRLHRVRVGPFASAELADAAQKRLEAQGFRQILRR